MEEREEKLKIGGKSFVLFVRFLFPFSPFASFSFCCSLSLSLSLLILSSLVSFRIQVLQSVFKIKLQKREEEEEEEEFSFLLFPSLAPPQPPPLIHPPLPAAATAASHPGHMCIVAWIKESHARQNSSEQAGQREQE